MSRTTVAVAAFDGILPFHLSVPCAVFGDSDSGNESPFDVRVCGIEPGPLQTRAGFSIHTHHGLDELEHADIVVVPSWRDPYEPAPPDLLETLRQAHRRGATVVGLCVGAYVLAEAGLLDSRRATTHWQWSELFRQRFPQVQLDLDVLYVDQGDVITSAGTAAGIDCCLHLVRRSHGANLAAGVARTLVTPLHRQGNQAQYIDHPIPASAAEGPLSHTLAWAAKHLDQPLDIDTLAQHAAMSRRSFTRHFRQQHGTSVGQWLLNQRLALAQRLLETSDLSIERVAEHAGFGTALSLRLHFGDAFQTTPSNYRREFRNR